MVYQLRINGELDQSWSDWLGDLPIAVERQPDGSLISTLTVKAVDQSALFGILERIRDLNLTLIAVTRDGQEI